MDHNANIYMSLSNEIWLQILLQLDGEAVACLSLVCKGFYSLTQAEFLWKQLCIKAGIEASPKIAKDFVHHYYGDGSGYKVTQPPSEEDIQKYGYWWKKHYFTYHCIHFKVELDALGTAWSAEKAVISEKICHACPEALIWLCLYKGCGFAGCGRTKSAHALQHHQRSNHPLAISIAQLEIWCYKCDRYLVANTEVEEQIAKVQSLLLCEHLESHQRYLERYTNGSGESRTCNFCGKNGIHYKCIVELNHLEKARIDEAFWNRNDDDPKRELDRSC